MLHLIAPSRLSSSPIRTKGAKTTTTTTLTKQTINRKAARSIEEKNAQAEALHASIAAQVEQLRDSDRLTAFLDFAQAFKA